MISNSFAEQTINLGVSIQSYEKCKAIETTILNKSNGSTYLASNQYYYYNDQWINIGGCNLLTNNRVHILTNEQVKQIKTDSLKRSNEHYTRQSAVLDSLLEKK